MSAKHIATITSQVPNGKAPCSIGHIASVRAASIAQPTIAVGYATSGRAETLGRTLVTLSGQTRPPNRVIIAAAGPEDVQGLDCTRLGPATEIVFASKGTCTQRNAILAKAKSFDVLVFFDDDFIAAPEFLAEVQSLFALRPDVAIATGQVLADGILGPGLSLEDADEILEKRCPSDDSGVVETVYNAYGCNMAIRMAIVRDKQIRFDENLPLYGWLEDVDFSRRMSTHGCVVKFSKLLGVHLGAKRGRTSGVRFGYSQVANPVYLMKKQTMSWRRGLMQMSRNVTMNLVRQFAPEPWVDRRGRLLGNVLAVTDLCRRKLSPSRINEMR
jgi:succinoglycan biosynthesis transport protein ExoP